MKRSNKAIIEAAMALFDGRGYVKVEQIGGLRFAVMQKRKKEKQ